MSDSSSMSVAQVASPVTAPAASSQGQTLSLALTREVTCIRSLAWRCDLPAEFPWERLARELEASGFQPRAAVRGLVRLVSDSGDEVVLVTGTGRVQLRVHYTVPEHERRFAAERLFQALVYAIRAISPHAS
jgi:hypothetical protein